MAQYTGWNWSDLCHINKNNKLQGHAQLRVGYFQQKGHCEAKFENHEVNNVHDLCF